jgi:hypothetical protein
MNVDEASYCLDPSQDTELAGYPFSNEYQYVSINVKKCVPSASLVCKSTAEIDGFFSQHDLKVLYLNSNFNFKDFSNYGQLPAQYYIEEPITLSLDSSSE